MTHDDLRHKLSEYIDGTMTPGEKTLIDEHLKTCSECSTALGELQKTIEYIKKTEEVDAPSWMTQKIMTKVRAEEEKKAGLFRRLFLPLHVKLPLEALGVLFLAVTVFFINRNIQQAAKFSEAPVKEFSESREASPPAAAKGNAGEADESSLRAKKVPQKPEYKALDMKPAYKGPPPAVPEKKQEPVPAQPETKQQPAPARSEAYREKQAGVQQDAAPGMMKEEVAPSTGFAQEAKRKSAVPQRQFREAPGEDRKGDCLAYDSRIVSVTGVITKKDFPGRPNYESIEAGDERETYWILKLDQPVCVAADKNDDVNQAESNVVEMQLVLDAGQYNAYRALLSKPVAVQGTLFHSHTGHHHTPVLLQVQSMIKRND